MGDYFKKYLKYKNKYLHLKGGGEDDVNILIVSHNNRIKCLLKKLGIIMDETMNFMNGAIIKLTINVDKNIVISILFKGIHNNDGRIYLHSDHGSNNKWKAISFEHAKLNKLYEKTINNVYNFYIVISGEANESFFTTDPDLNENGKNQAINASSQIEKIKFNMAFVSDLKRSRQTMSIILEKTNYKDTVYVLPCSHELKYTDNPNGCDADKTIIQTSSHKMDIKNRQTTMLVKDQTFNLSWNDYDTFYKSNPRKTNEECINFNIIGEALRIYESIKSKEKHMQGNMEIANEKNEKDNIKFSNMDNNSVTPY
jgi:broad specificity phosphatase PhoE